MAVNNYPSIPELRLKTDILSTDSNFKLSSIVWYTGSDGTSVSLTASDFGTGANAWGVFEPRTSRQEFFKWACADIASATTTGVTISARGLPFGSDYTTESSTRKFSHPAGSKVLLFTDYGAFWNTFVNKANAETITGLHTFPNNANYPKVGTVYSAPTDDLHVATKKYADDLAIAGSPDASTTVKGIIEIATAAEMAAGTSTGGTGALLVPPNSQLVKTSSGAADENKLAVLDSSGTFANGFIDKARTWGTVQSFTADNAQITSDADSSNDAVRQSYLWSELSLSKASGTNGEAVSAGHALYLKASDGKLWRTDADGDESTYSFVGFANNTVNSADGTVYYSRAGGIATGLSGLTAGSYYFLSGTAGAVATSPHATRPAKVGQALSTTTMRVVEPYFTQNGTTTITGTGNTTITTGFYPTKIQLLCAGANGAYLSGSLSSNSDTACIRWRAVSGGTFDSAADTSNAFVAIDGGGTTNGTISSRTQTTFVINCATKGTTNNPVIHWRAESA